MFDIGFSEILIVATLTLIIMGPKRLPETVKTITLWLGRIRNFINSAKVEIENEVGIDEIKKQLHNEKIMNEIEKSKRELNSISKDLSMSQENEKG
ncbi:MAG: Sec-independent protein translocase protein TatB [Pseudomonadota bacterium]|jgi:sec-independent protein translocase protein TatB|nr:twin-arginine translocase subunit TatB [Porticoccaceae bacterium]MCH2560064.1 Sec-independent protein translocase protein TatB [Pseudomonadales bacterium]MEC7158139.1 Sec-independent protein translocase protein TatB [Pseudomonadota bacterium]MAN53481.1 twin-arginine translocase subunit TatB [Porticoccaceae bacterium]MBE64987.1 twin-arginine translocase subunit TatB [Porticoccaceae bacterium]|tara:strand:+ start:612 stop:899 length:288 start_codon:yes stop_codon:yes gene_type:complete